MFSRGQAIVTISISFAAGTSSKSQVVQHLIVTTCGEYHEKFHLSWTRKHVKCAQAFGLKKRHRTKSG